MRTISIAKHKRLEKSLRDARALVVEARTKGLAACKVDPHGGTWDARGIAIDHYLGARRWVRHYQKLLAESQVVKGATRWYVGRES